MVTRNVDRTPILWSNLSIPEQGTNASQIIAGGVSDRRRHSVSDRRRWTRLRSSSDASRSETCLKIGTCPATNRCIQNSNCFGEYKRKNRVYVMGINNHINKLTFLVLAELYSLKWYQIKLARITIFFYSNTVNRHIYISFSLYICNKSGDRLLVLTNN